MAQIHFDITADASNLVSTVNKATGQMREFASMMKDIGAQGGAAFDTPAKQIKALEDAIKSNERVMEEYKKKIEELTQKQREAALAGDTKMVNALGEDMNTLAKQMAETSKETDVLRGGLESMTGTSGNAGKATGALGKNIKGLDDVARILPGPLRGIATGISNVVKAAKALIATPVGLVLAGLSAALAGVSAWLKNSDQGLYITVKMSDKLQSLSEKVLNTSKRMKALEEATRTGATKSVSEFMKLQSQWNKAKESGEGLNKVYPKIRKELSSLGVSVNSVAQAESVLVQNAGAVIQSFIQKAKAAALYKEAEEEVAQALDLEQRTNKKNTRRQNRADRWRRNTENVAAFFDKALPEDATNFAKNSTAFFSNAIRAWGQYHGDLLEARISDANTRVQNLYEKAAETFNEGTDFEKEGQDILKGLKAYTDSDYNDYLKRVQNFKTLLEKSKREMEQRAKEIEFDRRAAEINALDEGSEKVRAQMKLNYDRELASIDEWYEGLRDEKIQKEKELFEANPANAGKAFTYDRNSARYAPTASETALYGAKRASASAEYLRGLKEQYDEEIREFGSYYEKRAQIVEKWEKKIAGLQEAGHRAEAQRQMDAELQAFERQYSDTYARIFSDIDGMSEDLIKTTIDLAENEIRSLAITGEASAEQFKALRDRVVELKSALSDSKYRSYGTSILDVFKARDKRDLAAHRLGLAQDALSNYESNYAPGLNVSPEQRKLFASLSKEWKALKRNADEASDALEQANEDLSNTAVYAGALLASNALGQIGDMLQKLGHEDGAVFSQIANSLSGVLTQLASGNIPGAIASGVVSAVNLLTDALNAQREAAEAAAQRLSGYNRSLQELADQRRIEQFSTLIGNDDYGSSLAFNQQLEEAIKNMATLLGEAEKGETTVKDWLGSLTSMWAGIPGIIAGWAGLLGGGTKVTGDLVSDHRNGWEKFWGSSNNIETKSWEEFIDPEGNLKGDELRAWYEQNADGMTAAQRDLVDNLLAEWDRYQEGLQQVKDYWGSIIGDVAGDVASEMVDNYIATGDAIADMTDNMDDFAASVAKSLIKSKLIEQFYNKFDEDSFWEDVTSGDDDRVTDAVNRFKSSMESLGELDVNDLLAKLGLGGAAGDTTQQSSAGGFQTMSQDTANELNGRFTALQINSEILVQNSIQGVSLLQVGNTTLLEIRNFHIQEVGYLADIAKQTKPLLEFGAKLDQIQRNTANLR